ncbi:hypothetical protein GLE_4110 [Lysobacter enzymogenes]|uniref:Uncharacterized protein n=1 Tax=Lysobacter enzymogenes TaxID=69 RepID=A0A0S2DLJ1_LYSEN|nr:hypothetical protein GLE_4110 [Lysobacter enzymogenes]
MSQGATSTRSGEVGMWRHAPRTPTQSAPVLSEDAQQHVCRDLPKCPF